MLNTFKFGQQAVKKHYEQKIAIFIKDIGCFAFFYGGVSVITKHWQ